VLALHRKLERDLWRLRGQVLAVALVIASGVAVLVMSLGTLQSLEQTADTYYERSRFADVFAGVKRAPERMAGRIAALPGVQAVETRISRFALLDFPHFPEPVIGQLVSLPDEGPPLLNRPTLRAGRWLDPERVDEVMVSEPFAEAHDLAPGDAVAAVLNGHRRELRVVGTVLSPEFVYAIGPGALMPDDQRFGILWMGRRALAAAFDLEGAFDDVSLALERGADARAVIGRVDALLAPYGGRGAYERADQVSNWFLRSEIDQLANLAGILPVVFLSVAAFLTNMVLERLIAIERPEIGLLKAFGYTSAAVGWHYVQLVLVIGLVGIALGFGLGWWFGREVTAIYADFYHFPYFFFRPSTTAFAVSGVVSLFAALLGTGRAVRRAVRLPPAEAMRPPAPALYSRAERGRHLEGLFDQPTRMIFRQIVRWPGRSFVTTFGIAMAVGLMVTSLQWTDAIEGLAEAHFERAQHMDATLGLVEAQDRRALRGLAGLPGVLSAEPLRFVSARIRSGHRFRREPVQGLVRGAALAPAFDVERGEIPLPPEGLLVSRKLAELLHVDVGDRVTLELLEGRRPTVRVPVAGTFETLIGTPALMDLEALSRLLREPPLFNAVHLRVDAAREPAFFAALEEQPRVSMVMLRRAAIRRFHETMAETMLLFVGFFVVFSSMLAFGVSYNATRVALSERARELATLRVLGLSKLEISYILLGEVAILTGVALPFGCLAGAGLSRLIADRFETELYRVPLIIEPSTYGLAMAMVLVAAAVAIAIVRRRVDRLDLIEVLKTRE